MSTSTNNEGNAKAAIPQVTTFQFSNDAIGQVKDSVNLFTGTANLPLNIASLPGRKDLDVNIGIMYSSNVQKDVRNWNLSNPTGILGLGWDMAMEKIVVNKNGSGTASSDEYYMLSNGSGNKLVQDGIVPAKPVNIQTFQTRNYEFWDIKYDPSKEKWTVIKEDGTVYIYGDNSSGRNTLQFGVGWGNWLGDSALAVGQEQYVTCWNLSEIQNVWGEKVIYSYDNVQVKTGSTNGLEYTQASYIKTITDSFGRIITFNYGEKFGAKNPGTKNIVEYQAANAQQPSPNAYQEQYETRFLDTIDVENAKGKLQFSILFEYDFINLGAASQTTVYPLMWKRVLTSFWQVQPNGKSLPGMEFEYYKNYNDVNAGALKNVVYPQGAEATYTYKQQLLNTSRNINLSSPLQGGTPRVWFGPDYTVVTWYNATTKILKAIVYSWCGNWTSYELNSNQSSGNYFNNVDFDIASLGVIAKDDFIALYFTEKTKKQLQLFLYRRDPENFGVFDLTNGPQYLPLQSATAKVGVQAGNDFVLVYGKGLTNNALTAFQWNWKQRSWNTTPGGGAGNITVMMPSPSAISAASDFVVAAFANYYIAALYTASKQLLQFQLFYHDGNNVWNQSTLYSTANVKVYNDPNNPTEFPFSLSLSSAFAVATYITDVSSTEIDYSLRTLQWDKSFNLLNAGTPLVNNYKAPVSSNKPQFSVFNTILTTALVTNNPNLSRYIGGPASGNNPGNWKQATFATMAADAVTFATGLDISLLSKTSGTSVTNQYLQFIANAGTWAAVQNLGSTGTNPTIYGNYITAGKDVFYKNAQGQWIKQQQGLNNLTAPQTVQNRGASYIAYQDNTGSSAQTYFAATSNGILGTPQQLPLSGSSGQKIYVDQDVIQPGTILAGTNAFVTYPADQEFDAATSLTLFKVVDGQATGNAQVTPVAYIEIANAYDPNDNYCQSYDYSRAGGSIITYDAQSSLAQFPKVTVVTGSKIPNPASAPAGISISYFSNGVAAQGDIPYPGNWVYNYNQLLNGVLLQKLQYDNMGKLVTSQINYWQIYQNNINQKNYFYGAFYRISKSVAMKDGVSQTTSVTYYQDLGLQQSSQTSYHDSSGELKTILNEKIYAIQVDDYNSAMAQKHLLNAVAQESTSVTGSDGKKKYTGSTAVTWKNWANDGSWKWAALQNYQWMGSSDGLPTFNFSDSGQREDWLKKQEVAQRGLPFNVITEMLNVDGVSSSYIYDITGQFQIAEFLTASRQGDEASFYSFEPYEDADNWQLGADAVIIPNDNDTTIDAKIGMSSLKINSGIGITRQFTPQNQNDSYVFSGYVKLPEGFDPAKGNANWIISFTDGGAAIGSPVTLPFGTTVGSWQYVYSVITLPQASGAITVTIKAVNDNTVSAVLIDSVRFSPLQCLFSASSVDQNAGLVNAVMGSNGEVRKKFFDDFQRIIATTGFSGDVNSIATSYFSRTGNDNVFSVKDPNARLSLLSAGGGPAISFTQGNEWSDYWTAGPGALWQQEGDELVLSSFTTKGTLAYSGQMAANYGILVDAVPLETLTQPAGFQVGTMFTVQWDPSVGTWQLLDNNEKVLQQKNSTAFSISKASGNISPALLAAALKPALLRRGKNISADNLVTAGKSIYDTQYRKHYNLSQDSSSITVSSPGNEWLLLVNKNTLFFFSDGQLIFNYVSNQEITGNPSIFAGNSIALGSLITSFDNQLTFTCVNETGNDKQSQLLEQTQLTITENIYDNCGRIIANTKPAFVTSDQADLFAYCDDFAVYDPTTGIMLGLIADFYPDDEGYPYFGTRYEASPLGRSVEKSMPGKEYSLGMHTQTITYGSNDGSFSLPASEYSQITVTDQNGNTVVSITDKRGLEVRKISSKSSTESIVSAVHYDDNGNPVEMQSPNYIEGAADSENWVTRNQYNLLGQLLSTDSNTGGQVLTLYDNANRLRFRMDAEAASQGTYQYYKYDRSGRIVETGYVSGPWDITALQKQASNNPELPSTPDTWRLKTFYDDSGTGLAFEIGQVVKTQTSQNNNGQADVEENFTYDIYGNVKSRSQKVTAFDGNAYITNFNYNNLGGIVEIGYPVPQSGNPFSIYYSYNSIGQIIGISDTSSISDNLAAYQYNPAGKPLQEILNPHSANPVIRAFRYTSQVWLQEMEDTHGGTQIFAQQLNTDASASGGPAYYNGQPAAIDFEYPSGIQAGTASINWYNGLNALEKVNESGNYRPTLERQYTFDNNGNFATCVIGTESLSFKPEQGNGDRLESVTNNSGTTLFSFTYNENGAVTAYTAIQDTIADSQNLNFSYDPGTRMTTQVENMDDSLLYSLYYSSSNDRVLKQESSGGTITANTLYIKSLSGNTLVQLHEENDATQLTCIMYGPVGIVGFIKDNQRYNTLKDHLGSVRVILDANAAVIAAYDYDLYGNVTVLQEPESNFFPYLYTSQEFDIELGIYNYKARFYFSRVGRFGVMDNYNQFYSPYIYAGNSPMVYVDPSGNFSIGNFFSAIGGAIIGAFEILIGVAVDVIAGVLEVLTLGLSTPVSVGLSMVAGAFIGSGVSAVSYSAVGLITNDFSWKEYGINTAVGFVAGAITAGFGAVGAVAAEAATGVQAATKAGEAVSTLAKVANSGIKAGFTVAGAEVAATASTFINNSAHGESLTTGLGENLVSGILSSSLSWALPDVEYQAGWGNLFKRVSASIAKSEAVGITMQIGTNAVNGDSLNNGLLNTMVQGVFDGSVGGLGSKDYGKEYGEKMFDFDVSF